jgi:hypothetical protein
MPAIMMIMSGMAAMPAVRGYPMTLMTPSVATTRSTGARRGGQRVYHQSDYQGNSDRNNLPRGELAHIDLLELPLSTSCLPGLPPVTSPLAPEKPAVAIGWRPSVGVFPD